MADAVVHAFDAATPLVHVESGCADTVRAAQAGDPAAFGRLVERYWCDMVRLARSVSGDGEAEDCVQDGLLDAWHALPKLADPERFRGWLARIVFRRALRAARWRKVRSLFGLVPERAVEIDPAPAIDLTRLLARLPPRQRAVLHLTIVEEMSDSEIGEVLSIGAGRSARIGGGRGSTWRVG